jgi:hypothetical protein
MSLEDALAFVLYAESADCKRLDHHEQAVIEQARQQVNEHAQAVLFHELEIMRS